VKKLLATCLETETSTSTCEAQKLRRCIRDLVALSALPAVWINYDPRRIAESLADVLQHMLHLDFIYIAVREGAEGIAVEVAHTAHGPAPADRAQEIGRALTPWLGLDSSRTHSSIPDPLGSETTRIVLTPFEIEARGGVLVAGSRQADFPTEVDRLLLGVGANQAAILLEHRRAEEALRESEERLRLALEAGRMGTWDWNILTNEVSWSREQELIHGLEPGTFGGTFDAFLNEIYPEDREFVTQMIAHTVAQGTDVDIEFRLVRPDGSIYWNEARGKLIRDETGKPVRMLGLSMDVTERKRAEEALRESEERFRCLSACSPVGNFQTDVEGRCTYTNPRCQAIAGFTFEESLGEGWAQFVHPEDRDGVLSDWFACAREGREFSREYRFQSPQGSIRWVHVRTSPMLSDEGRLLGYVGTIEDITGRKRAEDELRSRAHQQATVAELGQQALAGEDLTALMDQAVALVAQTLEVEYASVLELLPESQALLVRAGVGWTGGLVGHATVDAGLHSRAGYTLLAAGPVIVEDLRTETRFSGPPLLHDHGVVSGMSVIIHGKDGPFGVLGTDTIRRRAFTRDDVHFLQAIANILAEAIERKQAEQSLRREKDFAEGLIETAQAIVLVLDTEGRIARFNPYMEQISGYHLDEVRGQDWSTTFVPERDRPRAQQAFVRTLAGDESSRSIHAISTKHGGGREIDWSNKALKDGNGTNVGVLAIGHDITALKDAQRRALQAERLAAIGEMVAGLAHESRNALHRGQVCLEMLALEVEDRPEALRLIGRLQKAQDDLHALYEDVRSYAAPIHLERRTCDLAEIWRAAWAHLEHLRQGWAATLREESDGLDLHCAVDPFRLEQVFRNILENSLAACRDLVEIAIHCTPAEIDGHPALRVAVRDHGPGLGPEQKQRLFEPFFTTKTKGTGLGMAIARRIVEAHGGRIAVGEDGGPGAEIILTLPRGRP
jgi:PAS domain S-box-containing protein